MKRAALRVRTGVRAPALPPVYRDANVEFTGWTETAFGLANGTAEGNMTPLVPLIRCTMPVPCGVCWYCKTHAVGLGAWGLFP